MDMEAVYGWFIDGIDTNKKITTSKARNTCEVEGRILKSTIARINIHLTCI